MHSHYSKYKFRRKGLHIPSPVGRATLFSLACVPVFNLITPSAEMLS